MGIETIIIVFGLILVIAVWTAAAKGRKAKQADRLATKDPDRSPANTKEDS